LFTSMNHECTLRLQLAIGSPAEFFTPLIPTGMAHILNFRMLCR